MHVSAEPLSWSDVDAVSNDAVVIDRAARVEYCPAPNPGLRNRDGACGEEGCGPDFGRRPNNRRRVDDRFNSDPLGAQPFEQLQPGAVVPIPSATVAFVAVFESQSRVPETFTPSTVRSAAPGPIVECDCHGIRR